MAHTSITPDSPAAADIIHTGWLSQCGYTGSGNCWIYRCSWEFPRGVRAKSARQSNTRLFRAAGVRVLNRFAWLIPSHKELPMSDPSANPPRQHTPLPRDPNDPFAPARPSRDERLGIGRETMHPDDQNARPQHDRMDDEAGQNQPQRPGAQPRRDEP